MDSETLPSCGLVTKTVKFKRSSAWIQPSGEWSTTQKSAENKEISTWDSDEMLTWPRHLRVLSRFRSCTNPALCKSLLSHSSDLYSQGYSGSVESRRLAHQLGYYRRRMLLPVLHLQLCRCTGTWQTTSRSRRHCTCLRSKSSTR